jgi:1-acyl-sn-glycerol-3-phosphate acyltransferase
MGQTVPASLGRFQSTVKTLAGWAFTLLFRLRVDGASHVPDAGPVILAGNHRSMLDVPLLVVASPRPVTFMAKRGLFRGRLWTALFHGLGGFPVEPGTSDRGALDMGMAVLDAGAVLGVFPEGTRSFRGPMGPFLNGTAWLALRSGAPIVPCAIVGTEPPAGTSWWRWLRPRRVGITFGPPIVAGPLDGPVRRTSVASLTESVRSAVASLQG